MRKLIIKKNKKMFLPNEKINNKKKNKQENKINKETRITTKKCLQRRSQDPRKCLR